MSLLLSPDIAANSTDHQPAFCCCVHFCSPVFFFQVALYVSYTSASSTLLLNEFQWMGTKLSPGSALVKPSHWPLNQQAGSLLQAPLLSSPSFVSFLFLSPHFLSSSVLSSHLLAWVRLHHNREQLTKTEIPKYSTFYIPVWLIASHLGGAGAVLVSYLPAGLLPDPVPPPWTEQSLTGPRPCPESCDHVCALPKVQRWPWWTPAFTFSSGWEKNSNEKHDRP